MILYSIILLIVAASFVVMGIAIYRGKTDLIHDYHQTKVTDKAAYGKAFGKSMLIFALTFLLSAILGLIEALVIPAVVVLMVGLVIGIGCIIAVQRKYNQGLF